MTPTRRAIQPGHFSEPLDDLSQARLAGSRCRSCGETYLGRRLACPGCTGRDMEAIVLSRHGTLYTFTVCRHRPPGDYKGGEPPYAVGLVTLPEGLRIIAPLAGHPDHTDFSIGMAMELVAEPLHVDEAGDEIVAYRFRPTAS